MFNLFKKKNISPAVSGDVHALKTDRQVVHHNFVKENILGFSACLFSLMFHFVLRDIILSKTFTFGDQVLFIFFFCFNMGILTLMLFQLRDKMLMW